MAQVLDKARFADGSFLEIRTVADVADKGIEAINERAQFQLVLTYPWLNYTRLLYGGGATSYAKAKDYFLNYVALRGGVVIDTDSASDITFSSTDTETDKMLKPKKSMVLFAQDTEQLQEALVDETMLEDRTTKSSEKYVRKIEFRDDKKYVATYRRVIVKDFVNRVEAEDWLKNAEQSFGLVELSKPVNYEASITEGDGKVTVTIRVYGEAEYFESRGDAASWLDKIDQLVKQDFATPVAEPTTQPEVVPTAEPAATTTTPTADTSAAFPPAFPAAGAPKPISSSLRWRNLRSWRKRVR